jgi:hypothetical protein
MSRRIAAWLLAWSIWALCVALATLTVLLSYLTPPTLKWELSPVFFVPYAVLSLAYPTVGALIASRRPKNPIGWIFCVAGFLLIATEYAPAYAHYAMYARSTAHYPGPCTWPGCLTATSSSTLAIRLHSKEHRSSVP